MSDNYRVYQTVLKMLLKRSYLPNPDDPVINDLETFLKTPDITIFRTSPTKGSIFVFFPTEDPKVGVKPIRLYRTEMDLKKTKRAIIVTQEGITPFAKGEILSMTQEPEPIIIEIFTMAELIVDITEHDLVPEHILLTDLEKTELLKKWSIKEQQLPKITMSDPISRYYGFERSQVIKIPRPSETAGTYYNYRVVI